MSEQADKALVAAIARGIHAARARHGQRVLTCCEAASDEGLKAFLVAIGSGRRLQPLPTEAAEQLLRHIAGRVFMDWRNDLDALRMKCESPIEELFLLAVTLRGLIDAERVILDGRDAEPFSMPFLTLRIATQVPVGKYRIDFGLTAWYLDIHNKTDEMTWHRSELLVECDGHDFHERTKEQARHDREKDRVLQRVGFRIFRFTGSELWADALAKAGEAIDQLVEAAKKSPELERRSDAGKSMP